MHLIAAARHACAAALNFCFPSACAACHEPADGALCDKCQFRLHRLASSPLCGYCASPLAYDSAPCARCKGNGPKGLEKLTALGIYEPPLSQLIQTAKYRRAWEWVAPLADLLVDSRGLSHATPDKCLIVPIPLHPLRRFARGYNQAELIAEHLSRRVKIPWATPLLRIKRTETQTHMPSAARREANVRGAFALDAARSVRGRHVILVDDVSTTGATLRAAATAIRTGRPLGVSACVLALADPKHRAFEIA